MMQIEPGMLLPLTVVRPQDDEQPLKLKVMHVPQSCVQRLAQQDATLVKVHLNTRIVDIDGTVRRRFWLPDASGVRHWGWVAGVPNHVWLASARPQWYWVLLQAEHDTQGGIALLAFIEGGYVLTITPAA